MTKKTILDILVEYTARRDELKQKYNELFQATASAEQILRINAWHAQEEENIYGWLSKALDEIRKETE